MSHVLLLLLLHHRSHLLIGKATLRGIPEIHHLLLGSGAGHIHCLPALHLVGLLIRSHVHERLRPPLPLVLRHWRCLLEELRHAPVNPQIHALHEGARRAHSVIGVDGLGAVVGHGDGVDGLVAVAGSLAVNVEILFHFSNLCPFISRLVVATFVVDRSRRSRWTQSRIKHSPWPAHRVHRL